ncbi:MAG: hypothetical protein ABI863_09805, partial [Ginsengibacter sp.]
MKPGFYFLMLLLIFTIITVSCNKNPESPAIPAQVDSLKPALPIQIIHTQDHTETDSVFYNYQTVSGGTKIITFVT